MPAAISLLLATALAAQGPAERQAPPPEAPHHFGLGAAMGVSNRGGGGSFRYFVNDRLGLDMNVWWYRPTTGSASSLGSAFVASPSFIWMLNGPDPQADIDVRPYVGGGLNYSRRFSGAQPRTSVSNTNVRTGGIGGQVFGGVEMTFKEAKAIAISAEVAHHEMAATGLTGAFARGTNLYLVFHYYLN